jgi:superfamily II DNA helicase RecQ
MTDHRLHVRGFDRPNLYYTVEKAGGAADKSAKLVELVRMREGGVALVYAATRKNAETYAQALKKAGMRARVYHAGLEDNVREKAQDVFMAGKLDVIVATNAFGMGVDKSDIRLVVHDVERLPQDRQPERPDVAASERSTVERRLDGRDCTRRRHGERRLPEVQDPRRPGR